MKEYIFNFSKIRKNKGITQVELAHMLKVSQQHISAYERGERTPGVDVAARIADALGVTVDELIVIKDAKEKIADKLSKMVNEYEDK